MPLRALRIGYVSGVHATGPLYDKMRKPVKWFLKVFSGPLVRPPDHRVPVLLVRKYYPKSVLYKTPGVSYTERAMRDTQEEGRNEMSETQEIIRSFGLTRNPYPNSGTVYDAIRAH